MEKERDIERVSESEGERDGGRLLCLNLKPVKKRKVERDRVRDIQIERGQVRDIVRVCFYIPWNIKERHAERERERERERLV